MDSLQKTLAELTIPGRLYEKVDNLSVRCTACAHRCLIRPGKQGICKVRFNEDGLLKVPWGYVTGAQADPIEKKPFFHFLSGSDALTFGMLGCNFHCGFCQNYLSSQALRDPVTRMGAGYIQPTTPKKMVRYAVQSGAQIIASSYNEPLISSEWAADIFRLAQEAGLHCAFVSNGYATQEVLQFMRPFMTAYKIDLKTMQEKEYRTVGGLLQNVLDSIKMAYDLGYWVEVVTLVIPGFNDSVSELWDTARFLVSISPDIPWHVTAFHPDYKMHDRSPTQVAKLEQAAEIGQEAGLHFVYAGNIPGRVGSMEDTYCPSCQRLLIHRRGFQVLDYHITANGTCPQCHTKIAGIWTDKPENINLGGWGIPRRIDW